ncbi:MAG TPA: class I SAM-dependent methyltransferase [Ktedonobacteraceae bacterium]|jgi:ubiquinone/menaquinone biosynthesis C-methylase UbiE
MAKLEEAHRDQVNTYFQNDTEYWQQVYVTRDARAEMIRDRHEAVLRWIDQLGLPPDSRVLEVGCGAGFMALALAERGYNVQAIDSVAGMIEVARKNAAGRELAGHLALEVGDTYALQFADACFDLVLAVGVLSWLEHIAPAIQEMARVLKPGGHLLLTCGNQAGLANQFDPVISPLLTPLKIGVKSVLVRAGLRSPTPVMRFPRTRTIDRTLARLHLARVKGETRGFGFSFLRRSLPDPLGSALHRRLQGLADRGTPLLRSTGRTYHVLARKEADAVQEGP